MSKKIAVILRNTVADGKRVLEGDVRELGIDDFKLLKRMDKARPATDAEAKKVGKNLGQKAIDKAKVEGSKDQAETPQEQTKENADDLGKAD